MHNKDGDGYAEYKEDDEKKKDDDYIPFDDEGFEFVNEK